jgi:hypothetical protein
MRPILLAACALSACSIQPADQNAANEADRAAVENIVAPPAPQPTLPPQPANAATEAAIPIDDEGAEGAANVVRTYYALIGRGDYAAARALWEDRGAASGMSAEAFAASFARYRDYRAEVGAPGRVDPGAGQRYVAVPVRVHGTLRDGGRPFNMEGSLILHRTVVDGATAEQKSWRIRESGVRPRPAGG